MQPQFQVGAGGGRLDFAFKQVLSEAGATALFFHLENEHGVTSSDVTERPADFAKALASILGEYGSGLLLKRVYEAGRTTSPL